MGEVHLEDEPNDSGRVQGSGVAQPDLAVRPVVLNLKDPADGTTLERLMSAGVGVSDTLRGQLGELVVTRDPSRTWTETARQAAVEALLADVDPSTYGRWVYYPWRRVVVHLLGPEEFHELRTSRNRNKITRQEQQRLRSLRLGVAGLSVGSSTALTLVQEGLGCEIRLADFDELELSNLNRIRATVLDLGLPKTTITARAIAELDPYVDVRLFAQGITEETMEPFLEGLDLLFEECDDLAMKIRLRTGARQRRIPVLMETSDRGMLDVERFDLEPDRPLLHGLAADLRAEDLEGLSTYEKVPAVLRIIGVDTMSERLGASLPDIDTNLKTWPQLASAVALGGALNTDAARRIALGTMQSSGRFFVDLSQLASDEASGPVPVPPPEPTTTTPLEPALPGLEPRGAEATQPDESTIRSLVSFASLAPSGGNCQPWQFRWDGTVLELGVHPERGATLLDYGRHASLLGVGAALEYLRTAAAATGWCATWELASPEALDRLLRVTLRPAQPDDEEAQWVRRLSLRVTNRRFDQRQPLPAGAARALSELAFGMGASLHLIEEEARVREAAEVIAEGERFRMLHPRLHRELLGEVRFTDAEVEATRDGIDLASLEMDPTQVAGIRMLRRRGFVDQMAAMGTGQGLGRTARKAIAASAALGLLRRQGQGLAVYVEGGRALARVWALATDLGLAFQPMSPLVYLFERLAAGDPEFDQAQRTHLQAIRRAYERAVGVEASHTDLLLFRLAPAPGAPTARSPRMDVERILEVVG